jgi:hypothetical protein
MLKRKSTITSFLILVGLAFSANSQSLNARFSTSFYSWESHLSEAISNNHFRIYQTARATVGQLANGHMSLHLYGQFSKDVGATVDEDAALGLYSSYLQWKDSKGILKKARLGRQRVYGGVGYGTMDGVDADFNIGKQISIGGYVGLLVPYRSKIELAEWDERHTFGARFRISDVFRTKVLFSYMRRDRTPTPYVPDGQVSSELLEFNSKEQELAGIDLLRDFSSAVSGYGRLDYDLLQERIRRAQVELTLRPSPRLELAAEFFHRSPLLAANSIFTVFDTETTQDIAMRANYALSGGWRLNGNVGLQQYSGDENIRFALGASCKYGHVGYNFRSGYGGYNNGLFGSLSYPLRPNLSLMASTGISRYSLLDEDGDRYTAFSSSAGFNFRPNNSLSLDLIGQNLRTRWLDSDVRVFARANYWFFTKKK